MKMIRPQSLGLRLSSTVIIIIAIVIAAYSTFAVNSGRYRAQKELATKGELLANHLAFSSRIGVFAENRDLLKDVAGGIVAEPDVILVGIYNVEMKPLYLADKASSKKQAGPDAELSPPLVAWGEKEPLFREQGQTLEFRKPVVFRRTVNDERQLYFDEKDAEAPGRTIGYVRIVLSQESMNREIRFLLIRNALAAFLFISVSIVIVYLWVKKAVKPLETLTLEVRAMGMGSDVEQVPVQSRDEIGRLAAAFNTMVNERKSAEQALEKVLMDIHDGIGGITTSISLLSEVAKKASSPEDIEKALKTISGLARDGMVEVRSLMYSLDRKDLKWRTLAIELRNQGTKLLEPHAIAFTMTAEVEENIPNPGSHLCLHLFRIYRESLMNVIKHAKATKVTVSLRVDKERFVLMVQDDGQGCARSSLTGKGRGVGNMMTRVAELNGTVTISGDAGTCVTMEVPLAP